MNKQSRIREELGVAERGCDKYYGNQEFREAYIHFSYRRRFFLKDLLRIQLKDFDHA